MAHLGPVNMPTVLPFRCSFFFLKAVSLKEIRRNWGSTFLLGADLLGGCKGHAKANRPHSHAKHFLCECWVVTVEKDWEISWGLSSEEVEWRRCQASTWASVSLFQCGNFCSSWIAQWLSLRIWNHHAVSVPASCSFVYHNPHWKWHSPVVLAASRMGCKDQGQHRPFVQYSGYRPLHTVTTNHHDTWSATIFSGLLHSTLPFRKHITYYMHGFTISMLFNMQIKLL